LAEGFADDFAGVVIEARGNLGFDGIFQLGC